MIVMTTMHIGEPYTTLASKTWDQNRRLYAERQGYQYYVYTEDTLKIHLGFVKLQLFLEVFEQYPDTEYVLWTGTDTLVTNFNIKVQDRAVPDYDVMISGDFNYHINSDVIIARNTDNSKRYFRKLMSLTEQYTHHHFGEQQAMLDIQPEFSDVVALMPQRYMNSYEYSYYNQYPWFCSNPVDVNGTPGQWQPGDWIVHFPAMYADVRNFWIDNYMTRVIK